MKLLLHTLMILAYGALVLRPSMPMLEYELQKDFIASEYCVNQDKPEMQCDGKCYLNKRLAEAGGENPDPVETVAAPSLPVHVVSESDIEIPAPRTIAGGDHYRNRCNKLHSVPTPTPPPKWWI